MSLYSFKTSLRLMLDKYISEPELRHSITACHFASKALAAVFGNVSSNILEDILYIGLASRNAFQDLEWVSETHCSPENEVGQRGTWRTGWGRQRWK